MRISKTLVAFCAIALCAVQIGNAATDTEAQAKAREALRKKLAEEGQTTPEPSAVAPIAPVAPAAVVTPPATVVVTTSSPATATRSSDPSGRKEEQLRQATRQKIQELNQQDSVVTSEAVAAPAAVIPAPAVSPVEASGNEEQLRQATRQKIQELNQPGDAGTTSNPKASDAQVELMRQRLRETIAAEQAREQAARTAATVPPPETDAAEQKRLAAEEKARDEAERATARAAAEEQKRAEAAAKAEEKASKKASPQLEASGFKPIVAPPSGLAGSKEARLADLTRRYKADEMTPEEYHKERAKLIAEP